jgi:putative transposase
MAINAVKERGICIRVACRAFRISESCYRYERKLDAENEEVATWLIKLTDNNRNWGFGLCYLYLRNLKGFKWNHKRVYRVYKELELEDQTTQAVDSREARGFNCATGNQSGLVNGLYA